jgi:ssDNA-binding Zn-finger/Zn-ribbon topoisomerase 1
MAYPRKPPPLDHIRCPECGVPMVERKHFERGAFYGCTRFPVCVGTRPVGPGQHSYTKLLFVAYDKALVFLSGPKFLAAAAPTWLLSRSLGLEEGESLPENCNPKDLPNDALEIGIDAAIEYLASQGIDHDFLIAAHNERMLGIKSRLRYNTGPMQLRNMPKAVIQRRYDMGTIEQFEASITADWRNDGQYCPRCGEWAEAKTEAIMLDVFLDDTREVSKEKTFDCGECGIFTKKDHTYTYERDKHEPGVAAGITLGTTTVKKTED